VTFQLSSPKAQEVSLVGDFNCWSDKVHRMTRDQAGTWRVEVDLRRGTFFVYAFVIDGRVTADPQNPVSTQDGRFSIVEVPAPDDDQYLPKDLRDAASVRTAFKHINAKLNYMSGQLLKMAEQVGRQNDQMMGKDASIELLKNQLEMARLDKTAAQRDNTDLRARLDEVSASVQKLRDDNAKLAADAQEAKDRQTQLQKSLSECQTRMNVALQDKRDSGSEIETRDKRITELEHIIEVYKKDLEEKILLLEAAKMPKNPVQPVDPGEAKNPANPSAGPAAGPGIKGRVLGVSNEMDFVMLDVGTKHGVKVGDQFNVVREGRTVAKVFVDRVEEGRSYGKVMEGYDKKDVAELDVVER
jgi:hypothetical protein